LIESLPTAEALPVVVKDKAEADKGELTCNWGWGHGLTD
jgi:hypothetical protein